MKKKDRESDGLASAISISRETTEGTSVESVSSESEAPLRLKVEKTKTRQKNYVMDLRIHSPASLGYLGIEGLDTAPALVRLAKVKGLDVIAVTDFYSGSYVDRITEAAKNTAIVVIPGVDLRCVVGGCNEVVISCLFQENFSSQGINEFLSALEIPESAQGDRMYLCQAPLAKILNLVDYYQGVALPSRLDKTPHRMLTIPVLVEQYGFRAFDLAYPDSDRFFKRNWPKIKFNLFSFSNANALAQVGSRTARVKLSSPGFSGVKELVARAEPI